MSDHPPMPLADAERIAAEIVEWLRPVCDRIEVAGSVRRRKPEVRDIEIVCVPKIEETALDLFGQATDTRNRLDYLTGGEVDVLGGSVSHRLDKKRRPAYGSRYKRLVWNHMEHMINNGRSWYGREDCPLDLFSVIPPAQWGVIMAIRTGPAEFSRRLVTRKSEGGLLPDHMWVRDGGLWTNECIWPKPPEGEPPDYHGGSTVHATGGPNDGSGVFEERDVFEALGIPWIEPEERR